MSVRCFIAIELDEAIRRQIARLQERLQKQSGLDDRSIKWVRPENIHLTLKFLGEVSDSEIIDICAAASEAAASTRAFDFEVGNCGCFPPAGSARVLWVGLTEGSEAVTALAEAVDQQLQELGYAGEHRRFSGHLTLARIKQAQVGRRVSEICQTLEPVSLGVEHVGQIIVFQSVLTRSGPQYTALHHAPLAQA